MLTSKAKSFYRLVKPGVLYGNVLTGIAGYLFAAAGDPNWRELAAMTIGMSLVVGSACAMNNLLDRDIDSKMARTRLRPSVTEELSGLSMAVFSILLLVVGAFLLSIETNMLVVMIGLTGWLTYVWLYGAWTKRTTPYGTITGSISGAMPIAGGYAAHSGQVDIGMAILFLMIFFWQFPEFYSIAIYRRKEYSAAEIPVITVARSIKTAIRHILLCAILYTLFTLAPTLLGYTGWVYFVVMLIFGIHWTWLAIKGLKAEDSEVWAKKMFRHAMINILVLCLMLSIGPLLP